MAEEEKEQVKENPAHILARRLQENRKSLYIARVPDKTKADFIALAEEEFCGDYGMALKWLMDDLVSADTKLIMEKIAELESEINLIKNGPKQEAQEKKTRKMLNGEMKRRSN